ncbi:uncharacterized protein LOC118412865 [Branchiostoma floridae]|uniref:Uncharacterized protein LOC118412865 n=1 Tax=Branchiostoma floridae TaxID=7739 RepID=A0A9J7MLN5_BRAFL|nr:uncharacterized protein LOC118412865 [Branchiostoma floridae]
MKWTRRGALSNAPGDYLIIPHLDAVVGGRQFARAAYTTTTPSESVNARNPGQGRFAGPDGGAVSQHAGSPPGPPCPGVHEDFLQHPKSSTSEQHHAEEDCGICYDFNRHYHLCRRSIHVL